MSRLPATDPAVVLAAASGDEQAWRVLYRTWTPTVLAWCGYHGGSRVDRVEAAQESFVRLHRVLGRLQKPESFSSFLHGIVLRVVREHRRRSWWSRWLDVVLPEAVCAAPSPERRAQLSETVRDLEDVLDALPAHHREILVLCRVQGLDHVEAAAVLDISPHTVRSRLSRAQRAFDERCRKRGLVAAEVT